MKPDRAKILKALSLESDFEIPTLSGPELRLECAISPVNFKNEIRALVGLKWIFSKDYRYAITETGKKALKEYLEKEAREGKNQELFK